MKRIPLFPLFILMALVFGFSSCTEENQSPKFKSATLSADNKTLTVLFTEDVYASANKTGGLSASNLTVTAPAGVVFTYIVTHTAGTNTALITLTITSVVPENSKFLVKPASATSVYDADGAAMDAAQSIESNVATKELAIMGKWLSEGTNVAPLLVTYFNVAKVTAEFKTDYTYIVNQFNIGNTTTTPNLIFRGTYQINKSVVGNIWTIDINQAEPYVATAAGIFEIKTNPEVLWYEIVQTSGTQNTPPTPAGGFGSSNGGTLGTINIQKFVRTN